MSEWHAHNLFRREAAEGAEYRWTEEEPLGPPVKREREGLCWLEQDVIQRTWTAQRILVTQKYSIHRMNLTKAAYYEFVTGDGGLSIDLAVDGAACRSPTWSSMKTRSGGSPTAAMPSHRDASPGSTAPLRDLEAVRSAGVVALVRSGGALLVQRLLQPALLPRPPQP